jgi:TP901-1 family phage major tail protein
MATTGPVNGTDFGVYVGATKVAHATSASISSSMSVRDATSKDSAGNSESLEGMMEWSIEGEGLFALDASYGYKDLHTVLRSRGVVTVRFSSETSGDEYHEGQAFLVDLSADAGLEETMTFSFSFTGTGPLNLKQLT